MIFRLDLFLLVFLIFSIFRIVLEKESHHKSVYISIIDSDSGNLFSLYVEANLLVKFYRGQIIFKYL